MASELRRLRIFFTVLAVVALAVAVATPPIAKAMAGPQPAHYFTVTTWQETTFAGIPFFVQCEKDDVDQWFELKVKRDGQYLPLVGTGYLQAYNIVWISWETLPNGFETSARDTLTFELYAKGGDQIGIKSVSLIADEMFSWRGDTPINPPQE